ncbi:MAG: EamA family transporter [Gemmataceae bacterium]
MNPTSDRKAPLGGIVLAFAVMYVAWGTTYLAIKHGVRDERLPVFLFGGSRIGTAGLILLLVQAARGRPLLPRRRDLPTILGVSLLLFVCGNGLITLGQRTVDSGMASVLAATTPLWMGLFAMLWPDGERLSPRGWLGVGLGLVGVALLLAPRLDDLAAFFGDPGPFLVIASAASWALGSLILKHSRKEGDHLTTAAQQMICGGLLMCLLGLALGERQELPERVTSGAAFAFCYLLIVGSLSGYVAFNWLLGHVSATKVGTYSYVNPVVAILVAWAAGETITWQIGAGILVILFGVFLVRGGEKPLLAGDEASGDVADDAG